MRILAAILLLIILSFNWFGYQLLSVYVQDRATVQLDAKLDRAEYAENELIELKIPIALPYLNNQDRFERYHGEIEIKGVHYTYVKRRMNNDSLILLCLPNREKTKMANATGDFFKLVNGFQSAAPENNNRNGSTVVIKNMVVEFLPGENKWLIAPHSGIAAVIYRVKDAPHESADFKELPEIPPEASIS